MKRGDTEPMGIVFCRQCDAAALMDAYFQAEEEHIAQETAQIQQIEVPQALIDRCQAQIHRQLLQKSRSEYRECLFQPSTASKVAAGVAVAATILFGSVWNSALLPAPGAPIRVRRGIRFHPLLLRGPRQLPALQAPPRRIHPGAASGGLFYRSLQGR